MALKIVDLVAGYGDITVLRGISCSVPEKSVVALLAAVLLAPKGIVGTAKEWRRSRWTC